MNISDIRFILLFLCVCLLTYVTINTRKQIRMLKKYVLLLHEDIEELQS